MSYSKEVMKRFKNPKFGEKMKNPDAIGEVGNATCGDVMKIFLKIEKNKKGDEIIKDISFQTFGCVAAISSSDALCELAKGKTIKQALKITRNNIVKKLQGLPNLKFHCSVLGEKALKTAIENYKKKKK
ncbi:MAG: iron-sulfur cluster assembly scaffold protein [Nanoarchaeota archaeon]|nr:iron-sulfur cluster assembly scaffold protein [Nanoarchaeota archaeon]MCG2717592.1 iron-sulfur cluster assembly scaffold protein [Nanoarchaeota archaeon]